MKVRAFPRRSDSSTKTPLRKRLHLKTSDLIAHTVLGLLPRGECFQTLARFHRFRTLRIALNDLAPGGAVIVKLFRRPIEGESYSLPVVAIEAVVVQIVTELWRACGGDLTSFKAALGFT